MRSLVLLDHFHSYIYIQYIPSHTSMSSTLLLSILTCVRTKSFHVTNHQHHTVAPKSIWTLFMSHLKKFALAGGIKCRYLRIKSALVHHINYGYVLQMETKKCSNSSCCLMFNLISYISLMPLEFIYCFIEHTYIVYNIYIS